MEPQSPVLTGPTTPRTWQAWLSLHGLKPLSHLCQGSPVLTLSPISRWPSTRPHAHWPPKVQTGCSKSSRNLRPSSPTLDIQSLGIESYVLQQVHTGWSVLAHPGHSWAPFLKHGSATRENSYFWCGYLSHILPNFHLMMCSCQVKGSKAPALPPGMSHLTQMGPAVRDRWSGRAGQYVHSCTSVTET